MPHNSNMTILFMERILAYCGSVLPQNLSHIGCQTTFFMELVLNNEGCDTENHNRQTSITIDT